MIEETLLGYYRRIEVYKSNRVAFRCDAFVNSVTRFKNFVDDLIYFCEFRWNIRDWGIFYKDTLEKMDYFKAEVCSYVAKHGCDDQFGEQEIWGGSSYDSRSVYG